MNVMVESELYNILRTLNRLMEKVEKMIDIYIENHQPDTDTGKEAE